MNNGELINYVMDKEYLNNRNITLNQISIWYGIPKNDLDKWLKNNSNQLKVKKNFPV